MGIYNSIHPCDDDLYFYCPTRDCPCHGPAYHYDSSGNIHHSGVNFDHSGIDDYFLVFHHHHN
jgi:hypothetical protein